VLTCGNNFINAGEACDDGNTVNGDGCNASCRNEPGWACPFALGLPLPGPCSPFELFLDSPAHGIFTTAGSIVVSGHYTTLPVGQVAITVNGVPASSVNQVLRTYSHTVPLSSAAVFNPIRVTLTNTANGDDMHARVVVINGQSVADGAYSPQSVALRINDTGLDTLEPLVGALAASQFNLAALMPPGTVLADECFINAIGCWGSARVTIGNPPPSYGSLGFTADSKTNVVGANIAVNNLRVDIDIDGSGLVPDCGLRLTANQMLLSGDYALQPDGADPNNVDVNLATPIGVNFGGFNHTFTYGLCDAPIIGDIIQAFLPDIEQFAKDGITGFLSDPDGAGPQDSPIADGIETALAGISIAGPVGEGLGLMFNSPLFQVVEDPVGITFGSNSRFQVSVGSGPGQCIPPPGAPNFTASYSKVEAFPSFGATTPVLHTPYGLGIAISSAGFNQLLRGQTECGLMRTSLTMIDIDGAGGAPPLPITSTLLSLLVPEFGQLPDNTPLRVDIAPTIAPIVTGNAGPGGELTELKIAHVSVEIVETGPETVWLAGGFDARLGMDLDFLPDGSGLAITLAEPSAADTLMAVTYNPLGTDEVLLEAVLPGVIRPLIPQLAGALSGFPLPSFFGLNLAGVEVSRAGQFLSLYANLAPAP
jgi:cysteine-rich repeat protein